MYLDAIEANYSHEQMTPLNSILSNSKIIYKRISELMKFQESILDGSKKSSKLSLAIRTNQETLALLKGIQ